MGDFKEDQANGEGVLHFKNGDTYEGPFKVWVGVVYDVVLPNPCDRRGT